MSTPEGHTTAGPVVFDDVVRFRIPVALKAKFSRIARARMKKDSELAREVFQQFVNSQAGNLEGQ